MKIKVDTVEAILAKMKGKSITSKWDAIIFYNRSMSNHVLEQEYIKFFTGDTWYPPLTKTLQAQGQEESIYLHEVIFSQPMVSFVSRDDREKPTLQLTWFIKEGSYILYKGTDIRSQGDFNPVTGPTLTCELEVSEGGIKDGNVILDLTSAWDWKFSFTNNADFDNQFGYLVMQELLSIVNPEHKGLILSRIVPAGSVGWNPTSFRVEVKIPKTARLLDGISYDDGAIKVYVGLDGNDKGGVPTPESDIYMIPSDGDYTAAIVISNKAIMQKVLSKGFTYMGDTAEYGKAIETEITVGSEIYQLDGEAGSINLEQASFDEVPDFRVKHTEMLIGKVADSDSQKAYFNLAMNDEQVTVVWKGYQQLFFEYYTGTYVGELNWQKTISGKFITVSDAEVSLKLTGESAAASLLIPGLNMPEEAVEKWDHISGEYNKNIVSPAVEMGLLRLISNVPSFNTFALQSVLFKNGNVIALEKVHTPGDMVVFGKFRPGLTSIEIVDAMPHLVVGEVHKFEVDASAKGKRLIWSVAPLSSSKGHSEGGIGTINESTGVYTAPTSIAGKYIQVKVTVKDANSDATSVALVSISKVSIQIVPGKFKVDQDGGQLRFKAVSHNKAEVTLTMPAHSVSTCARDPDVNDQWIFTAGKLPYIDPEHPDYGTVNYLLEKLVFSTGLTTGTAVALIVSKTQSFTLSYTLSDDKKTAQFVAISNGAPKQCSWTQLFGPGAMSEAGVYTFDPETEEEQTIIVNATFIVEPSFSTCDFFSFTNLGLLTQQIRAGNAPHIVPCDIDEMERFNKINRNRYIN